MMTSKIALLTFLFFSIFLSLPIDSFAKTNNGGFTISLIHRDSPHSPFYDPSATASDLVNQAAQRSLSRLHYFQSTVTKAYSLDKIQSSVIPSDGEFLMKLAMGSPPLEFLAVIDTGSDLIWTQCVPCNGCNTSNPLFDPRKSKTYTIKSCTSPLCQALVSFKCKKNGCKYKYPYGDNSYVKGDLASETFTFSTTQINNIAFGCTIKRSGDFDSKSAGLVGLGGGSLSLISQLGSLMPPKFSYCLTQYDDMSTGVMNFGDHATVTGNGVISTPITKTSIPILKTFYFLTLNDITVGARKLNIPHGTFDLTSSGDGGLIIDSGSTSTSLNPVAYDLVESAVRSFVKLPLLGVIGNFKLCYKAKKGDVDSFPSMTFHFSGGDVHLRPLNTVQHVTDEVTCLAMGPSDSRMSIYGNIAQQNFRVGYDLEANTVSFQHSDCTKM